MEMMVGYIMKDKNMKLYTVGFFLLFCFLFGGDIREELERAGKNKGNIQKAMDIVPKSQRAGMEWLIKHMPDHDLKIVSSSFLLDNCELAYNVVKKSSWGREIPDSIFFEYVLPFGSLNERRDNWRKDFYNRFYSLIKNASSAYEAVTILNNTMFEMVGVKYSTKRPKADQSPYESMEAGLASCTGLSILLVDACRSIGVPARFVGTPMWYNNTGNHSWVEIWDDGWHFTGAAEPTGNDLNKVWFSRQASRAVEGHPKYGIYAATWGKSELHFPMDWLPDVKIYNAIDVTENYTKYMDDNLVPIQIRAIDSNGNRKPVAVTVNGGDNFNFEGMSKSEACDINDHLTLMLPKGKSFTIKTEGDEQRINVTKEKLISLSLLTAGGLD